MSSSPHLSIVSPIYNSVFSLDELVKESKNAVETLTDAYEIILVDDGSSDESWQKIEQLCAEDPHIKGIKLSRNFGQHYAVSAGVEQAMGEITIIIDSDLQDDPQAIHLLYEQHKKGFDTVFTKRIERKHPFVKSISTKLYFLMFGFFADTTFSINQGSLVSFNARVKAAFLQLKEKDRLYIPMLKWVGFNQATVDVVHRARKHGKSSYNFASLIRIAILGWTSHSDKLLRLSIYLGFMFSLASFISIGVIIVMYFTRGFQSGWASVMSLLLFSTGSILISIGVAGLYIGKTFEQSKGRPLYFVEKKVNI